MARRKSTVELVSGLDIGSSAVRIAVGQLVYTDEQHRPDIKILGTVEVPSEGMHKAAVTSIEDVVSSLSNAFEQMERLVGVPIEHAWVGIGGTNILTQESKGVVAVARSDGEISPEDVTRAVEAAQTIAAPLNYELLHVLPRSFSVDGQIGIKDPVGMTGIRVEVDTKMIFGLSSHVQNLSKAVYRTGVDIDDLVLGILAAGEVVTTQRQRELGVIVVNIGASTTSVVVYEDGDIIHAIVLPIGAAYVTNDLAIGLRNSIEVAEQVKIEIGQCVSKDIPKKEIVNLQQFGVNSHEEVSVKYVSEIVEARMTEILEKVDDELSKIDRAGLLPAGVVFTGGGSKIEGLVELSKRELRLPASLGYPVDLQSASHKINDLAFSTAIGLVKWGGLMHGNQKSGSKNNFAGTDKIVKGVSKFFKSFIP